MKKITSIMLALLMLLSFAVTASAAGTATKDGLSVAITSNADAYFEEEPIAISVKVKNNNDFAVKNIAVETLIPEGLHAAKGESTTAKFNLDAGETKTICLTVYADRIPDLPVCDKDDNKGDKKPGKEEDPNCNEYNDLEGEGCLPTDECNRGDCADDECLPTDECDKDKDCDKKGECKGDGTCDEDCYCKQPCTGDSFNAVIWIAVLMFAVAGGALVLKGNKKAIKTLCVVFCLLMALAIIPVDTLAANSSIVVDRTVQVGAYDYIVKAKVTFDIGKKAPVVVAPTTEAPEIEEDIVVDFEELEEPDEYYEEAATTTVPAVEGTTSVLDAGIDMISGVVSDLEADGTLDKIIDMFK